VSLAQASAGLEKRVVAWRRHIHANPELSFREHSTVAYVREQLQSLADLELAQPTDTSLVATLRGHRSGRVIGLRADMDALPLEEETDVPFRSTRPGVMHACGHDGHTAMLLGAAHTLSNLADSINGEVRFIFQHAEEQPPGGARELVAAGVMDDVDIVIGCHLWTELDTGMAGFRAGPCMAGSDRFTIKVGGAGGHAAMPHRAVDPVAIAARLITEIKEIPVRTSDPAEPFIMAVTRVATGHAANVIPATATLEGTIRYLHAGTRDRALSALDRLVGAAALAHEADVNLEVASGYAPLVNDPAVTAEAGGVAEAILGPDRVVEPPLTMGAEDMSALLGKAPGTFFFVGARNPSVGATHPHHHPKFTIDEAALNHGVTLMVAIALRLLESGAGESLELAEGGGLDR
jgi:amidohydrolase